MLRLLNIELIKLWNNRSSKVLILAYFILLTSIALIASIKFDIGPVKFHLAEQGIFDFPYIWHFNTYVAASLKFFLAIVIVSMMANEYSNKTIKQNLIDGLSKKEFIASKFVTVSVFALVSTVFVFIITLILGFAFSDITELYHVFSDTEYLLAFFVKLVGFFSFCLFLGILIRRSAFALGFLFVWFIIEKIAYGLLRWEIELTENSWRTITQFFPLESMSNLIVEPGSRLGAAKELAKQVGEDFNFDYSVHWYQIVIVLAWTSLFIYGSYKLLQKRDL
ncbi:ABC-type transport system involved in multi-copper enzyme maturation permease subunit [Mesoflavibacter sabulilitoris]|jgi:ABC-type transport system involved in multi-copper enzyme maturation permease subunit|uniref:ABC transporter permease n=1 Tax=Mesoflavibacter zeaxanthinifaciens subsp. sabulilitoris TaxID=1520893 RepID=A0A2T1NAR5_9FLAO|nr:ABC transporter permease subunit [Mesoflavibacter zeaxanthinifaciens]MBB3123653.1 ABC-type transport system involved in multi-copper enzyme maturation permease subunit [Mesoflavibacter zeaxanthinifaciens subsp. sabulilitoris]MCP4053502.1 ABC transporter permease [Mesoflavibacter sp.]PSG89222.1 ABC transporter permease [Mesoflavibacter zeaxanthinifaciens subsp. sabulilitoris]